MVLGTMRKTKCKAFLSPSRLPAERYRMPSVRRPDDWTSAEAKRLAVVCRKHGLSCRVVGPKHYDARLHVFRQGDGFEGRFRSACVEADSQGIQALWIVVHRIANQEEHEHGRNL